MVCIVAALALSGCGRRGPLEPPPGAPPDQKASQAAAPKVQPPGAPGGLFRNTQPKPEEPETKPENASKRSSSFVLDPLL
ncbi:MAG TPA: lipoprotein [Rhodoblastus sp.]|nr:lipoprotein [Rhodoblastus sp.]